MPASFVLLSSDLRMSVQETLLVCLHRYDWLLLLMHALQGWCPPLPVIRKLGVRTAKEIFEEKTAYRCFGVILLNKHKMMRMSS
jgi:hypothetical protein